MTRVDVSPGLIQWAVNRSQRDMAVVETRFPKVSDWTAGRLQPTFRQLEDFAKFVHVPFGYLFLPEPPDLPLPMADFRSLATGQPRSVSPDLLDTVYAMRRRQAWLRERRLETGIAPLHFVGSKGVTDDPSATGREMRRALGLEGGWAAAGDWRNAVSTLFYAIEQSGVTIVINGVVGNNTHRKLNVEEFRGFALVDDLCPFIFVNGADAKAAQMFTIAHELAHTWLGNVGSGVSGYAGILPDAGDIERFCDQAAAEFLVPAVELRANWPHARQEPSPFEALAKEFKVSPIVAGRRPMDLALVGREEYFSFYESYMGQEPATIADGGNFYNNQNFRVGKSFARQVFRAAMEGQMGFKQAYALTGLNGGSFQKYAAHIGETVR